MKIESIKKISLREWRPDLAIFLALLPLILLQGCTVPGFSTFKSEEKNRASKTERAHVLGYQPVVEAAPQFGDDVPEGAIIPISMDLVRSEILKRPNAVPGDIKNLLGAAAPYSIGSGDIVGVIVYDHPELLPNAGAVISQQADPTGVSVASGFVVNSVGEINFPYVGRLQIRGLTEIEASELITKRLANFFKDPQVTVRIQAYRSRRAYVEGEVRTPGMQVFTDVPMTLAEAIGRAGGITSTGDRSFVTLTRNSQTTNINLPFLQEVGVDASKIYLENGDIINVRNREESKVYVLGEILRPSALLMRNGRLSLSEAIGESGGPNLQTSDPSQIYVIRADQNGGTKIFNLNAKNPSAFALAEKFPLQPRDVVYIDPVPLVLWSRITSLIVPSAQVLDLGSSAVTR